MVRRLLSALLAMLAASAFAKENAAQPQIQKLTFTNKLVDGKKTWLPADSKLKWQGKIEVTLINELDEPHGFAAAGLLEPVVVGAKETKTVSADAKKGDYRFHCQLHPAHVGGTIKVE